MLKSILYSFTSFISDFSFGIVTVTDICCELRQVTCWVEWDDCSNKVFCKTCKETDANGFLKFSTKNVDAFISVGFSNWKKVLEKFRSHEETETHKEGLMKLASSSKQSVAIQLNDQLNKDMENACSIIMAIFTTLRFLCRQGLSIRGHEDVSSNFIQLLELQKEDMSDLKVWMGHSSYKWLSHDIQNEIIGI
ncbi:hypothetical protein PR048_013415 [Dryococelus australis]|uniref:Uncharacterized protein n=1 Tax=Dryococelus australis TaxID=614101 RepID=A0ABQ9HSX1_9NEOP|nr:hypothetical protein PR048_013415 [Dryococelus australis]